jgi:creatinine amidohydrolase
MSKAKIMYGMTVEEVRNGLNDMKTIVVPLGVVEQHGYHLPLSVDMHNAEQIAWRASDISGCFVAPCMHYSFSGGTLPGTINLSPSTVTQVLMDIFRSLVLQGFKNIIVLLGHGGTENTQAAKDAAAIFQRLSPEIQGISVSIIGFWELSPTYMKAFDEHDYHAAKYETSLMLHWKPEMVHMERLQTDAPEFVDRMRTDPDAYLTFNKAIDSPFVIPQMVQSKEMNVGVMGIPHEANVELGATIAEEASTALAEYVEKLEKR